MNSESGLLEVVKNGERGAALAAVEAWSAPLGDAKAWQKVAMDGSLEEWRRLIAYQVLLDHGVTYPIRVEEFLDLVVRKLGFSEQEGLDMTRTSFIPLARKEGEKPFMINLPIQTPVGPASLYYSVDQTSQVQQASVYPSAAEIDVT
jgi:hypothetical protein